MHPSCLLHASFMSLACILHVSYMHPSCLLHASFMSLACILHVSYMHPSCLLHASFMSLTCILHVSCMSCMVLELLHIASCKCHIWFLNYYRSQLYNYCLYLALILHVWSIHVYSYCMFYALLCIVLCKNHIWYLNYSILYHARTIYGT